MELGLVSVITPCYNGAKYITETISSVMAQTYTNWEMLIIDDGSKDNSADIVQQFVEKDSRIKLFRQKNGGSSSARNHGIREAKGQYMALLDADDLWDPEFLEKQIAFINEKGCVCVASSCRYVDENSKVIRRPEYVKSVITDRDMQRTDYIPTNTGLYDMKNYGKIYLHEELKSIRDDYAFWIDIVKLEGIAYGNREVLASYRVLNNSVTGKKSKLIKKQYLFYRMYLGQSMIDSILHTCFWGIRGIWKYYL